MRLWLMNIRSVLLFTQGLKPKYYKMMHIKARTNKQESISVE